MNCKTKAITNENLNHEVRQLFNKGYKYVNAACVDERDKFRIIYSFDKDLKLINLEVEINKGSEI